MSKQEGTESIESSRASSTISDTRPTTGGSGTSRKSSKANKPRLSATQKNFNHKDAENKRRTAIRERFTELSHMVPGAQGQERSEQVMLGKATEFLREMLLEQRRLEQLAASRGIVLEEEDKMRDDDFGGPNWKAPNMEQYEASKQKRSGSTTGTLSKQEDDEG
jgi:hypothetical protein